jgi:ribosomal protein S18 acetylase RimI-like enzyme
VLGSRSGPFEVFRPARGVWTMTELRLADLTPTEYDRWWNWATREFASEHVKFGDWTAEEAPEKARTEFLSLLPEGTKTPSQYLFALEDPDRKEVVGVVWFRADRSPEAPRPLSVFIYHLLVYEPHRRKGFGAQAMALIETKARELGFDTIALQVLGDNHGAIALYEKSGYRATNLRMSKKLGS